MRLSAFTQENFYVLLQKIREVYAGGEPAKFLLPDEALSAFMQHCSKRLGDSYFRTPRTTTTACIDLLLYAATACDSLRRPPLPVPSTEEQSQEQGSDATEVVSQELQDEYSATFAIAQHLYPNFDSSGVGMVLIGVPGIRTDSQVVLSSTRAPASFTRTVL